MRTAGTSGVTRTVVGHLEDGTEVVVRRSRRRTRTVSAFLERGQFVVAIPDRLTEGQEREWVRTMTERAATATRARRSDERLERRAEELARTVLRISERPTAVSWVDNQHKRWGSCTQQTGQIRISRDLAEMPAHVLDAVLVHELAHLREYSHGPAFQDLVQRYPRMDEAMAFLDGVSWQRQHG
ncbi:M48 family metallopeptidase [Serinibacter salmoneus]|uniref:M48 metallopeptidase family protein n=1 Tax=Serinibacter salmoneus TaxID=556530 RepID=UPI000BF8D4C2|nr:M48 family metallopeptidase [Serinibacter salmoneus]